jgi:hypothetical protein
MEAGEWVSTEGSQKIHTGCLSRRTENRVISHDETSGFLFSETAQEVIDKAKETLGVRQIAFDGLTAMQIDIPRLAGQLVKVFELMSDGKFRTLTQIANATGCLETSAGARLRDLRKARFGSHTVISRQVKGAALVYEYRLIVNERKEVDEQRNAA